MSSIAVRAADEVAAYLAAQTVGTTRIPCDRRLIVDEKIAAAKNLQVLAVPHSLESKIISRGSARDRTVTVDIGIMKRAFDDELEALLDLSQGIADLLEGRAFSSGVCVEVSFAPLYDAELWLQQHSFFAVIVAKIRVLS